MSFELSVLRDCVARHGPVARVLVLEAAGSVPRGPGTSMRVWAAGQDGTIGGGALEFEAVRAAREALASGTDRVVKQPLGPALAQCCGGAVTLLTEVWDTARLQAVGALAVRPLPGSSGAQPLSVARAVAQARGGATVGGPQVMDGWALETISARSRPVWIYGAGHVGRAMVDVLAPLPAFAITWVDTALDRFPGVVPDGVTILPASNPAEAVRLAPAEAEHFVLTYSHALDLELCHRLLGHGFAFAGLIGSATKWARFRKRLRQLGHQSAQIDRITCPIGDPSLGKHPQAIAVGVVSGLLSVQTPNLSTKAVWG